MTPSTQHGNIRFLTQDGALKFRRAPKPRTLPPVRPNAGTEAAYRASLLGLVDEMAKSVLYYVKAQWRESTPVLSQDESPSAALSREVKALSRRWQKRFDQAAPKLARHYAKKAERRSSKQLERILREGGFSVEFKQSKAMRDAMEATVGEQVSLIRSIPQKYFAEVEGAVMRSASAGRDLQSLVDEIGGKVDLKRIGKGRKPGETDRSLAARTAKRAAFIARDQMNKATATMARVRHIELGITRAVWLHSHGGKVPRPTHLENDGEPYDVEVGWFDPAVQRHVHPGELPNCRCVSKPIVEGFS